MMMDGVLLSKKGASFGAVTTSTRMSHDQMFRFNKGPEMYGYECYEIINYDIVLGAIRVLNTACQRFLFISSEHDPSSVARILSTFPTGN